MMAYDKERYDEIQAMGLGDLVHTMMVEFTRPFTDVEFAFMQNNAYNWALTRLNELAPEDTFNEDHAAAMQAVDEAEHGG